MRVITPPNSLVRNKDNNNITIFLAGSIDNGKAEFWQDYIISYFSDITNVTFLNPRRKDWDNTIKQVYTDPNAYLQINWELNALDKADLIIMNFTKDSKSPISLLELGLYATSEKMIVCCPNSFYRQANVEIVCEKYGVTMFSELVPLLKYVKHTLKN